MSKKVNAVVLFVALSLFGCSSNKPNLEPLPPERLQDLLYNPNKHFACSGCNQCKKTLWAYKSVTKKDYEQKDFN